MPQLSQTKPERERERKALERNVLRVFERAGRTFAPTANAWHRSGDLLSDMARKEGLGTGCVLVTGNDRDFQRIRRYVPDESRD